MTEAPNKTKRLKRHTHGGKREGAGRPTIGTKAISVRFSGEELAALEAQKMDDETLGMTVKRLVRWQLESLDTTGI